MILSVAGVFSGCVELEDVDLRSNFLEEAENNFSGIALCYDRFTNSRQNYGALLWH